MPGWLVATAKFTCTPDRVSRATSIYIYIPPTTSNNGPTNLSVQEFGLLSLQCIGASLDLPELYHSSRISNRSSKFE